MPTSRHILVAEDEALAAMAIEFFLKLNGCRVTLARDGLEAIELFQADPADILVTDLRMPRLDGRKLIRRLRDLRPDLPVLVMTGYRGPDEEDDLLTDAWRPLELLRKPVSPAEILKALERLLGTG